MFSPEKWYEYEMRYKEYGIDMKPVKHSKEKKRKPKNTESIVFSIRDKIFLIFLLIVIGVIAVTSIQVAAYAAGIQCKMNEVIKENTAVSGEIENLSVKLNKANNIETIEEKAIATLGMIYPNPNDFVYIEVNQDMDVNFALLLKE
ncbi:MAG: hypothetical protein ACTTH0_01235 [Eubacteriales bacterium]